MLNLFRKKKIADVLADASSGYGDGELGYTLNRTLRVRDLTVLGIGAIVGAGIFSTVGKAAFHGGPGVVLLFAFIAVTCGFTALCYAEFAGMVPVSGSAYTYSYVTFGELFAWIIGWDLLLEYAIGNIVVAISWSGYFVDLLKNIHIDALNIHGIHIPAWLTKDYMTALKENGEAWHTAPVINGVRLIFDLPAFLIVAFITWITYIGIRESKTSANIMVAIKMGVILMVIFIGAFYVTPENWIPFLPNKLSGVLNGIASVFFAYIGFDAISTTAEECENPQRDLPRGMIYALVITAIIYISVTLVLTGMVNYKELNIEEPLAYVFNRVGLKWVSVIVAISAIIATASVILVFQVGQPRIWMAMSRDGLLPGIFARIHPKYKTPSFATLLTGVMVAVPALFVNMDIMVDLTSIGTLFAFALVSVGILKLHNDPHRPDSKFKVPFINAQGWFPLLVVAALAYWSWHDYKSLLTYFGLHKGIDFVEIRNALPHYLFVLVMMALVLYGIFNKLSLIPLLGFVSCAYLLSESGATNWERFLIWLILGLILYFAYGIHNSRLAKTAST